MAALGCLGFTTKAVLFYLPPKASVALAEHGIEVQAVNQCMRQINLQFIVNVEDFNRTLITLHNALI